MEKEEWCEGIDVFWQANAWVDSAVMREIVKAFARKKKWRHGGSWVVFFCDNLKANLDEEVKHIFGEGNVFVRYFPLSMTEVIQLIDAGYGQSLRCAIGTLTSG